MEIPVSDRASQIAPSATLSLTNKARVMREAGRDVISLAAGEPDCGPAPEVLEAAGEAANAGFSKYTPVQGLVPVREAICQDLARRSIPGFVPGSIIITCGAKQALFNALQVVVNPGDTVVVIGPYWVSYPEMIKLAGGVPKTIETQAENGYLPSTDDLEKAITNGTRVVILNSPSNPSGVVYPEDLMRAITERCHSTNTLLISDEIYGRITYDGVKAWSPIEFGPHYFDNTLIIDGASKAYAMTGWRIGWAAGPSNWIAAMSRLQGHQTSGACAVAQMATKAAIEKGLPWMENMVANFVRRRDVVMDALGSLEGVTLVRPQGAFYAFPDLSGRLGETTSQEFCNLLLEEDGVAVVPGEAFGSPGAVRISMAASDEDVSEGVSRLVKRLESMP